MAKADLLGHEPPPSSVALSTQIVSSDMETGEVKVAMVAPMAFTSTHGYIQGGFIAALVDEVIGAPVYVFHKWEKAPLNLDLHLDYLRPVLPGNIYGTGRFVKNGRNIAFLEAELYDEDGQLLVKAHTKAKIVPINAAFGD